MIDIQSRISPINGYKSIYNVCVLCPMPDVQNMGMFYHHGVWHTVHTSGISYIYNATR